MLNNFTKTSEISNIITNEEKENLIREMKNILDEYDYSWKVFALDKIINTWAYNMQELIAAFKNHPNYVEGKFMIAYTTSLERGIDMDAVGDFSYWLRCWDVRSQLELPDDIKKEVDKWYDDYLPRDIYRFFDNLVSYSEQFVSEETAEKLLEVFPFCHARKGKKTSRVFNEIFTYLGYAKLPDYNKQYAKFADALSPIKITRHTVLSINPLDYLTMSFGNSWATCQTIDKTNRRGMPNSYQGMHSSGVMSYMLDGTTMVFYTVDANYNGTDYWTQDKINRQLFHWGEEKLVQGRLYPQDNDGNNSAYTPFRNVVQNILSTIYNFPNLWTVQRGSGYASRYIHSDGTHYRDYNHFDSCTLSRIKGSENDHYINVGHAPICVECGKEHYVDDNINCCGNRCTRCGETLDPDETRYIDGDPYCYDCTTYCEHCNEYVSNDDIHDIGGSYRYHWVCTDCRDEYYERCDNCREWHSRESMYYINSEDIYVCEDCIDDYTYCPICDEYHHHSNTSYVASEDRYVCNDCAEYYYIMCYDCDELIPKGKEFLCDDGYERCAECYANYIAEDINEEEAM